MTGPIHIETRKNEGTCSLDGLSREQRNLVLEHFDLCSVSQTWEGLQRSQITQWDHYTPVLC